MNQLPEQLPEGGYLRLHQIVKHKKNPNPLIPISISGFWAKVKTGEFPQGIKIGPKTTAWRREDIYKLMKQLENKKK